jgi:hypothetical protein
VPQGQVKRRGMVLVAYAGPVRRVAALRNSMPCLPTDFHSLLVKKPPPPGKRGRAWCPPRSRVNTSRRALSCFLSCARRPSLARARTHVCNVGDGWRTAGADEGHGQ